MNKSDYYFKQWLTEWKMSATQAQEPRTRWEDGSVANYKSIHQMVARYDLNKGEWPINTLRPTALRGAFEEIAWFYQKKSHVIEEAHPIIQPWWENFSKEYGTPFNKIKSVGRTYGHTVWWYDLIGKLLDGLEKNPFGRRNQIDLWQETQMREDPTALPPCVFLNMWSVSERPTREGVLKVKTVGEKEAVHTKVRYLNLTLIQRSMDGLMTFSINPTQYAIMALMLVSHLNTATEEYWEVGNMLHLVNDFHIYDRHEKFVEELLDREPTGRQPKISLPVNKGFYSIEWDDFKVEDYEKPVPLSGKLEIAI